MSKFGLGNYAMNQAGVAAAVASYNDLEFLDYSKTRIVEARQMINEVARANGLNPRLRKPVLSLSTLVI